MANKVHKDLNDDELHVPKGFSDAGSSTALIKNESGQLEYRDLDELGETGPQGPQGPDASAIENIVVVNKSPGPDQFSTITAALASITDASSANRYRISVGPGVFVEDTLTMKEYVFVHGSGRSTIIQPDSANKNIIVGVDDSEIRDVILEGATGTNAAAIFMLDGLPAGEFNVNNVIFRSNYHFVKLDSTGGDASVVLTGCEPGVNAITVQPFICTGTGTGLIRVTDFVGTMENASLTIDDFFRVSGANNKIIASNSIIIIEGGASGDHGLHIDDGATAIFNGVQFNGFDRGIFAANVGAAPLIIGAPVSLLNSTIDDISIEHVGALGGIQGAATSTKVNIEPTANFSLSLIDPDPLTTVGAITLGDIIQGDRYDRLANLSKLARAAATMGRISGGDLSDAGGFNIDITSGFGFLKDPVDDFVKEINWSATALTIPASSSRYIYVDTSAVVSQSSSVPDISTTIILGRVVTDTSGIFFIERTPMDINQFGNLVSLFQREAFGSVYASGSIVSENATPLNLDVTQGQYWFAVHQFLPSGGTQISFSQFFRQAVSGFSIISGVQSVTNSHYDNGTGALTALDTGKFAKHSLYINGDGADEQYFLVTSQTQYDTEVEAEAGDLPTPPTSFDDAVALIASIIVQEGNANIVKILDNRPVLGFKAQSISAAATHANLLGLNSDDHLLYLLASGARAMSGDLSLGGNNITNVGIVDGVDVSDHGGRHNPDGADPVTVASPVTIDADGSNGAGSANSLSRSDHKHNISTDAAVELTDSTNDEGDASSLARSNHTHAHGNRGGGSLHADVTTSVAGFMSSSDKTKIDGIESNAKDDQLAAEVPYDNATSGLTASNTQTAIDEVEGRVDTLESGKQDVSEKGQANGYASLDGGGKVPVSQLPNAIMEYQGVWNASINSPTLADGGGNSDASIGNVYRVSVAGTQDLGSGSISYNVGDYVILNASKVWEKGDTTDAVSSIFGRTGNVTAQTGDYDDVDIAYTRSDGSRTSIAGVSDDVGSAINNLDDNKIARDGSQSMSGDLNMNSNDINNVGAVNSVVIEAHGSRHNPGGSDPVSTAAAVELTDSTNAEGDATSLARSNHTHAHGNRGGGTLHAAATTSVAGFMSAADKTKLDQQPFAVYQFEDSELAGPITDTGAFPIQALRHTTASLPTGRYRIGWYFEWGMDSATSDATLRIQLNDTDDLLNAVEELQDIVNIMPYSGFAYRDLVGVNDIDIDFGNDGGSTVTIRKLRIEIQRVG